MRDKNDSAQKIVNSWSEAEWFTSKKDLPDEIPLKVYKVDVLKIYKVESE